MSIKDWATRLYGLRAAQRVSTTAPPTTEAEYRSVMDKAENFDKLVALPGWEDACRFLVAEVNLAISEATLHKYEKDIMAVLVTRWDAKRELVDGLMAYIGDMQKERDRLVEAYRGGKSQDTTQSYS